jgi:hypothetical protein
MAKWAFNQNTFTPVAVADTTGMTSAGYVALQGGSSTQRIAVSEIFLNGQATSSTVNQVAVARDSTVGATLSGGNGTNALDPATAALTNPPVGYSTATTQPKRLAAGYLLSLGFNAFGGIVRWAATPGYELGMLGNTANNGELSISTVAGTGAMGAHILFEPF